MLMRMSFREIVHDVAHTRRLPSTPSIAISQSHRVTPSHSITIHPMLKSFISGSFEAQCRLSFLILTPTQITTISACYMVYALNGTNLKATRSHAKLCQPVTPVKWFRASLRSDLLGTNHSLLMMAFRLITPKAVCSTQVAVLTDQSHRSGSARCTRAAG
jgi:hypothetical protein